MSKHTGKLEVVIGDKTGTMFYDWDAISEIHQHHSGDILSNLVGLSPNALAKIMAVGFRRFSPEITEAVIKEESPPIIEMVKALDKALSYAYFGSEGVPQSAATEKKNS